MTLKLPQWFCHARPERSLRWRGRPLPLCARCTGIYPALAAGVAAGFLATPHPLTALLLAVPLALPLVVDGTTQSLGWRRSSNPLRLLTGLLYGFGCGICVGPLVSILRGGLP